MDDFLALAPKVAYELTVLVLQIVFYALTLPTYNKICTYIFSSRIINRATGSGQYRLLSLLTYILHVHKIFTLQKFKIYVMAKKCSLYHYVAGG